MIVATSYLYDISVSELLEVRMDKVRCILELRHLDIVLHFSMIDLSNESIDLGILKFIALAIRLFLLHQFILFFLDISFRPQQVHIAVKYHSTFSSRFG